MRSPEEVFQDYQARKTGILTALTTEVDAFFQACDPNSDNLCLYGNSDSSWVRLEPHCLWLWLQSPGDVQGSIDRIANPRRRLRCRLTKFLRRPRSRPLELTLPGMAW